MSGSCAEVRATPSRPQFDLAIRIGLQAAVGRPERMLSRVSALDVSVPAVCLERSKHLAAATSALLRIALRQIGYCAPWFP
jgi:hypothetical protein